MTIPLWCLIGGVVLPYLWAGASVPFRSKQTGVVDLQQPRIQAQRLTDGGAGAWGAQLNAWEALAVFTVATFVAHVQGVDPAGSWATASIIWLVARVAHGIFYIAGLAPLRIASFATGLFMSLWILWMAISAS